MMSSHNLSIVEERGEREQEEGDNDVSNNTSFI